MNLFRPKDSSSLHKKRLIDRCYLCGSIPVWRNKPLQLFPHIVDDLHRNVVQLCPNCSTQVDGDVVWHRCKDCWRCIPPNSRCPNCVRPSKQRLYREIVKLDLAGVEKKYGVDREQIIAWINGN